MVMGTVRKKRRALTRDEVVDWVFNNVNKKASEDLAGDERLDAFLAASDKQYEVDFDVASAWKTFQERFAAFKLAAEKAAAEKAKETAPEVLTLEEAEDDPESDEDDPDGEDDDGGNAFTILKVGASPLCAAALDLEAALNPIVTTLASSKGRDMDSVWGNLLREHGVTITSAVEQLQVQCRPKLGMADHLQLYRILQTFEYRRLMEAPKPLAKPAKALDDRIRELLDAAEEDDDWETELIGLAHTQITTVWKVSLKEFRETLAGLVWAEHGSGSLAQKMTPRRLYSVLGEVVLCMPLIVECDQIAHGHTALYQWEPRSLIVKMLQKTVRKHKLLSLLGVVRHIDRLKERLQLELVLLRITPEAFGQLSVHLQQLVVGAVAGKAREQRRQLTVLVRVLWGDITVTCTGYELVRKPKKPALDLQLSCLRQNQAALIVIGEVESVPAGKRDDACAYLKQRLERKRKTLAGLVTVDEQLTLMVPDADLLPTDQIDAIRADGALPAWLVHNRVQRRVVGRGHPATTIIPDAIRGMLVVAIELVKAAASPAEARQALSSHYDKLRAVLGADEILIDEEMVGFVERTSDAAARLAADAPSDTLLKVFVNLADLVKQLESCLPS
jgi:hypothetical protein